MEGSIPAGRPMQEKVSSYQQLYDLQNTTQETVGVLIDRLRPVLIQHPEAVPDSPPVLHQSGMAERVATQERILAMLNGILRDLDV